LSAGASYVNTQNTSRRQDNALAEQIRSQAQQRQATNDRLAQTVRQVAASNPEQDRADTLQQYLMATRAHRNDATGAMQMPVGASDAFKQDAGQAAAGVQSYGDQVAGLMARIAAPTLQRQREGFDIGNLGADLGTLRSGAQGDDFLNQLKLRAIRRDPWLDAGSQLGMGYATGKLYSGGKT
jgi:hypothetical protein